MYLGLRHASPSDQCVHERTKRLPQLRQPVFSSGWDGPVIETRYQAALFQYAAATAGSRVERNSVGATIGASANRQLRAANDPNPELTAPFIAPIPAICSSRCSGRYAPCCCHPSHAAKLIGLEGPHQTSARPQASRGNFFSRPSSKDSVDSAVCATT